MAVEINKILRIGGIGLIFTHQTIGMHDLPWDFFRFSDNAWHALFNEATGFRIIDKCLDYTQFVLPSIIRNDKIDAEKAAGFEGSVVLFEKTGECNLSWDVEMNQIINTMYPSGIDEIRRDFDVMYGNRHMG